MKQRFLLVCCALILAAPRLTAQGHGAASLGQLVGGLGTTARVLVIGAHPDDEDTQLIAWLTQGRHVETAYLSLTRGDGGQNLIGNELGAALGIVRTQELLAARRIDGGHQYFTRAFDFGFSKTDSEAYTFWPRDSILEDVVTVIRAFRPHVIVAVFSGTPADGHGHHQVSGQLAREGFILAADGARFPARRTSQLAPWTPLKLFRAARGAATPGRATSFNVGAYSPLLGRSFAEIANESRSQHLSQGFGILQRKGVVIDAIRLDTSRVALGTGDTLIFSRIDTSFARFARVTVPAPVRAAIDSLPAAIATSRRSTDLIEPAAMVPPLAQVVRLATRARAGIAGCADVDGPECGGALADLAMSLNTIGDRASRALLTAAGVSVEATAERELVALGDSVPVTVTVYNRGRTPITMLRGAVMSVGNAVTLDGGAHTIAADSVMRWRTRLPMTNETHPWWLANPMNPLQPAVFQLSSTANAPVVAELVAGEDRLSASSASIVMQIAGAEVVDHETPIIYRFADPARGEVHRPIAGVPAVSVLFAREVEYARANTPLDRTLPVHVSSASTSAQTVRVALTLPAGLVTDSTSRTTTLAPFASTTLFFRVRGTLPAGSARIAASATANGKVFTRGYVPIEHPHIDPQRQYRPAELTWSVVDVKVPTTLAVAYVQGVGDRVEPMLEQLGIRTEVVDPAALPLLDLTRFSVLVIGPRAYAANDHLVANAPFVLDFAKRGGTVVVQYGQAEMARPGIMPYPIVAPRTTDRVTDETAPVRVLDPQSTLLRLPNVIAAADFDAWVQERALYMPRSFDASYRTVLSMNDPGGVAQDAGILTAAVGTGTYVYTTLSFFRQLPTGNAGAARLFVNLLSADQRAVSGAKAAMSAPVRP
jgi:LmbE family N-acetylglucosaminyl deacetylase